MIDQRFREHSKRKRKEKAATRNIKTIAGRLVMDVDRSLDAKDRVEAYDEQLRLYYVLGQKRDGKIKIYCYHGPEVSCISRGKDHKNY